MKTIQLSLISIFVMLTIVVGCTASMSSRGLSGEKVSTVPVEYSIGFSFDQVWSVATSVIIDSGYIPSFSEKSTGLFVAKRETDPGIMSGITNVTDHLTLKLTAFDSSTTVLSLRIKASFLKHGLQETATADVLDRGMYDQIYAAIKLRLTSTGIQQNQPSPPDGTK